MATRMIQLVFSLMCVGIFADPFTYTITEHPYRFSTYFDMHNAKGYVGRVVKSHLSARTSYDLYDALGNFEGKATVQACSLGALFVWAKDIDVYDEKNEKIGFIDGEALTTASAKYSFYNQKNERVATAYLDYSCSGFILTAEKGGRTLGLFKRNFVLDVTDFWDIAIYEPEAIDLRLIKAFSAFAIDYQEYFKEDR